MRIAGIPPASSAQIWERVSKMPLFWVNSTGNIRFLCHHYTTTPQQQHNTTPPDHRPRGPVHHYGFWSRWPPLTDAEWQWLGLGLGLRLRPRPRPRLRRMRRRECAARRGIYIAYYIYYIYIYIDIYIRVEAWGLARPAGYPRAVYVTS